jgi:hypothetical protein
VLMAVLLLLVLMFVAVEPLLTALQTKGLQPSAATGIVLMLFLLMMMMIIVYEMLLSYLFLGPPPFAAFVVTAVTMTLCFHITYRTADYLTLCC